VLLLFAVQQIAEPGYNFQNFTDDSPRLGSRDETGYHFITSGQYSQYERKGNVEALGIRWRKAREDQEEDQ